MPAPPAARYPVTPQHPPIGVAVVVEWGSGRAPFVAARVRHPETRALVWSTNDRGRLVFLPCRKAPRPDPARPWAGWHTLQGDEPDAWWPQKPERWAAPLPDPLPAGVPSIEGRMVYAKQAFSATEAAEEMERDREEARHQAEAREPPEKQWWLDPHAVTYSAPGAITPREAEGRLMRAFLAEWWVRVERPTCPTFSALLARMARSVPLTAAELATMPPPSLRVEPLGRDKDDMLTALEWLQALPRVEWAPVGEIRVRVVDFDLIGGEEILRLRGATPPLSWRRIGEIAGRSHEQARTVHRKALAAVTLYANGGATPASRDYSARLEAVQDANLAAKSKDTSGLVDAALDAWGETMAKPVLGYPSKAAAIAALDEQGRTPEEIAAALGMTRKAVVRALQWASPKKREAKP